MILEKVTEEHSYKIDMTIQGERNTSKGVIRALGCPSHISLKVSEMKDSISIFPCDEDDVMSFRVPEKLLVDHHCVLRIFSKKFVHGIMMINDLDIKRTYYIVGVYLEEQNTAVFSLRESATLRGKKCEDTKETM